MALVRVWKRHRIGIPRSGGNTAVVTELEQTPENRAQPTLPRWLPVALVLGTAVQCGALAWELGFRDYSQLSSLLLEREVSGVSVAAVDRWAAWGHGLLAAFFGALGALCLRLPQSANRMGWGSGVAMWLASALPCVWLVVESWAAATTESHRLSAVRPWAVGAPLLVLEGAAQATRSVLPLLAVWVVVRRAKARGPTGEIWWARLGSLALAATFAAHGVEALALHPGFEEYLEAFFRGPLGAEVSTELLHGVLIAIGVVDLVVALWVLLRPTRAVLLWMLCWGAITAGARIVHGGLGASSQTLLRTAHIVVPLAVLVLVTRHRGSSPRT